MNHEGVDDTYAGDAVQAMHLVANVVSVRRIQRLPTEWTLHG